MGGRWNHNIHLHRVVLDAVPDGARRALDVGCGEGLLAQELRSVVPEVVAMDLHEPSLGLGHDQFPDVSFVRTDLLAHPFPPASFDLVASVATLHHVDARAGLQALADLVRPGGTLAVVGLARSRFPRDLPWELAGAVSTRVHKVTKTYWEHSSPVVWPPPETFAGMRAIVADELPGATFGRHVLWRWWCTWTRPT